MTVDDRFLPWATSCSEYFRQFSAGRYDADSQHWFILPREDATIDSLRGVLVIGSPGADGIEFCFRRGLSGVWAYYPFDQEYELKATSLADLERGWLDGTISV